MQIRRARLADVDAIDSLVQRAYAPHIPRIGRRPAPMDDDYLEKVNGGDIFVADDSGVIGAIVLILNADHILIENVAVEPHRQGEGVGRTLLAFAEKQALEREAPTLRLYTNALMTENLSLYSRLGYEEVDRRSEEGFERVFLTKLLAPSSNG